MGRSEIRAGRVAIFVLPILAILAAIVVVLVGFTKPPSRRAAAQRQEGTDAPETETGAQGGAISATSDRPGLETTGHAKTDVPAPQGTGVIPIQPTHQPAGRAENIAAAPLPTDIAWRANRDSPHALAGETIVPRSPSLESESSTAVNARPTVAGAALPQGSGAVVDPGRREVSVAVRSYLVALGSVSILALTEEQVAALVKRAMETRDPADLEPLMRNVREKRGALVLLTAPPECRRVDEAVHSILNAEQDLVLTLQRVMARDDRTPADVQATYEMLDRRIHEFFQLTKEPGNPCRIDLPEE